MLKMFCRMVNAKRVLELGTFVGYSAQCFAEALPDDGVIYTIEENDELEDYINEYLDTDVSAHRSGAGIVPQNTLMAFEYVLKNKIFKKEDIKDLKYNMREFITEWKKQIPIVEAEKLKELNEV